MLVKKYSAGLILSFLMCTMHAMELAISKKFDDEAYFRVAQYLKATKDKEEISKREQFFNDLGNHHAPKVKACIEYMDRIEHDVDCAIEFVKAIPDLTNPELIKALKMVDQRVKEIIVLGSLHNEFRSILLVPDGLTALFRCSLPKNFKDTMGMFSSRSHYGSQQRIMLAGEQPDQVINDLENNLAVESFSRDQMVERLNQMPIIEALSFLGWLGQKHVATVERRENQYRGSLKGTLYQPKVARVHFFTKSDLLKMDKQEDYVRSILEPGLLKISDGVIEQLLPLKDLEAFKADIYRTKKIQIPNEQIANWEVVKDLLLTGIPFGVMSVMPEIVSSQTNGVLQGLAGSMAGSYLVGIGLVPLCQAFDSDVCKKRKWFGFTNHMKITNGGYFLLLNFFNCASMATAQFILSYANVPCYMLGRLVDLTVPCCILGGLVYLTRAGVMAGTCCLIENEENRRARSKNRNGLSHTLGDLFDGPIFNT